MRHEMPSIAARALATKAKSPPFTQQILDRLMDVHEKFLRRQPGGRRAMISYIQAPGLDLSCRRLAEADFTGANFERAKMAGADFERASLFCADMRGVDARGANFKRADIRGASLRGAILIGANFDQADMRQAMLARVDLANGFQLSGSTTQEGRAGAEVSFSVDFSNCSLNGANLSNANLKGANFTGAMLEGAQLVGANLIGAIFDGAVINGADLKNVMIHPGAFATCVLDPSPQALQRVNLIAQQLALAERWIATDGAEGRPANLDGEDLRPMAARFASRRLTALSAKRTRCIGVGFAGSQLQGALFDEADLRGADFTGADLRGASFRGATLWHARFDRAQLGPLALTDGVRLVDLEGAAYAKDCFRESHAG
jgi:uncharacterized protein YjbI with pentapeptide repeats